MEKQIIKQNVGIDIAKDDFKVCLGIMTGEMIFKVKSSHTFKNTLQAMRSCSYG